MTELIETIKGKSKNIVGFFEESEGVKSYTRLSSFIAFLFASGFAIYDLFAKTDHLQLIIAYLSFSAGQKIVSKFAETKEEKKSEVSGT
jgi:hypothetical protein